MIDVDKLPPSVVEAIAQNLGWDDGVHWDGRRTGPAADLEPYKAKIAVMTPEEAFGCFCTWHGLIGWSVPLAQALDALRAAAAVDTGASHRA